MSPWRSWRTWRFKFLCLANNTECFYEADHFHRGGGALGAFVAYVAAGAMDRLFHCFTGEDSEQHGYAGGQSQLADCAAHSAVDVLVVKFGSPA